jgi:hypothetical protein
MQVTEMLEVALLANNNWFLQPHIILRSRSRNLITIRYTRQSKHLCHYKTTLNFLSSRDHFVHTESSYHGSPNTTYDAGPGNHQILQASTISPLYHPNTENHETR